MKKSTALLIIPFFMACSSGSEEKGDSYSGATEKWEEPQEEVHLANLKQLTFGGNNAEAYWSFDNSMLVFQSDYRNWGNKCDQIYKIL